MDEAMGGCKPPRMDGGHPNKQPKQKPHRRKTAKGKENPLLY